MEEHEVQLLAVIIIGVLFLGCFVIFSDADNQRSSKCFEQTQDKQCWGIK